MLCALTVRRPEPATFERFAEEFGPPESEGPPRGWVRFDMLRDLAYEERRTAVDDVVDEVVVNGVFEVVRDTSIA